MTFNRFGIATGLALCSALAVAQEQPSIMPSAAEPLPSPAVIAPSIVDSAPSVATPVAEGSGGEIAKTRQALPLGDFRGYRTGEQSVHWTLGDGDQFGSFWLAPDPYLESGVNAGIAVGLGVGFLAGPERTDMPPRLFDFSIGYQMRDIWGDVAFDIYGAVLAASDFEGSSRDGIRFPGHAVSYLTWTPQVDLVLGIDYLDRDDVVMLPVAGLVLCPDPDLRLELVFPRPRVELQLTADKRCYLFGGLAGGTWAVERDSELDDLATLYELQLGLGLSDHDEDGRWSGLEFIYLFDRRLEYASGIGDYAIGPTLMIRAVTRY